MSKSSELDIFNKETIAANRDGYMTKEQRKRVDRIRREIRLTRYAIVLLNLALLFSLFIALGPIAIICSVFIGLYAAATLFFSFWDTNRANRDLYKGLVESVEGRVDFQMARIGKPRFMMIEGERFRINKTIYEHINGLPWRHYIIYFAPHTNTILSMASIGTLNEGASQFDDTAIPQEILETDDNRKQDSSRE
jgi:hypothetical protein